MCTRPSWQTTAVRPVRSPRDRSDRLHRFTARPSPSGRCHPAPWPSPLLEQPVPRSLRPHRLAAAVAVLTATAAGGVRVAPPAAVGERLLGVARSGTRSPSPPTTRSRRRSRPRPEGKGVTFTSSFGASGDQSRAVANGQKADYVNFSIGPDMTRLVPGQVATRWNAGRDQGHRRRHRRGDRRAARATPEGHQGLGRPGRSRRQGRHPRPGLVGLGEVEHPRGLRPAALAGGGEDRRPGRTS